METTQTTKAYKKKEEHVKAPVEAPEEPPAQGKGVMGTLKDVLGFSKGEEEHTTGPSPEEEVQQRVDVAAPATPGRTVVSKASFKPLYVDNKS